MPAHSKITDEIARIIKELAEANYNEKRISEKVGLARGTVKSFCKRNNIIVVTRQSPDNVKKHNKFKQICIEALNAKTTIQLNKVLKEIGLHAESAQKILKENPSFRDVIRSKKQAILEDKTLSLKEAQSRLPDNKDIVTGFEDGKYTIRTIDGFVYQKTSAKLSQGDPRGKSGFKYTEDSVRLFLEQNGYEYVEGFTRIRDTLSAICNKCKNIRVNRLKNFKDQECSTCSNNGCSRAEEELNKWIKSLEYKTRKYRFKGKTKGKEIDIFIPILNLGIEYCGLYWHSENMGKERKYHYDKMIQANNSDLRLITIFEDEWKERQEQVKGFLKSVLNVNKNRVFARKCGIKEVDHEIARNFLETYHIQGKTSIKAAFGLYYNGELIGLVTGNKHHRQNQDSFVLNRLVFKDGYQVVGGASKLLKHLVKYARDNRYNKIVSWSDNRWSEGNVYEKCGFTLEENLGPDYSYTFRGKRIPKQSCQKKHLIQKGAIGGTEKEMAKSLGYSRIWDCGKKRWSILT